MVQLQREYKKIDAAGIQVVAVSYDSVETLNEFAKEKSIKFSLLSDPESKAIDAFHVRNEKARKNARQNGIPHPGTFLIDKNGIVRAKLFYNVLKRHTPDELIKAAQGLKE